MVNVGRVWKQARVLGFEGCICMCIPVYPPKAVAILSVTRTKATVHYSPYIYCEQKKHIRGIECRMHSRNERITHNLKSLIQRVEMEGYEWNLTPGANYGTLHRMMYKTIKRLRTSKGHL